MPCNACRMPVAAMESCVWRGMSNEEERVRIKSDGDNEQEMVAVWIRNLMRTNGSCVRGRGVYTVLLPAIFQRDFLSLKGV